MKIILCGYHWTGCKALELLISLGHDVYVYTHKAKKMVPDLEGFCIKKQIKYSTEKISISNLPFIPDAICSIYYRYIISKDVIDAVDGKIFNLHPSLLPQYRGCSSLTWAMVNGEEESGFTFHYIDEHCDTGNILIQKVVKIEPFDTQLSLYNRVMFMAMDYFQEALRMVLKGEEGIKQEGEPSYYKRGCPMNGKINPLWSDDAKDRFMRAMFYPPYPAAEYNGKKVLTFRDLEEVALKSKGVVVLIGCGGQARSVLNLVKQISPHLSGIIFDKNAQEGERIFGWPVLVSKRIKDIYKNRTVYFEVAIGNNALRKKEYELYVSQGWIPVALIANTASLGINSKIGYGSYIGEHCHIGPESIIGNNTIVNTGAIVEHETIIGDHCHIAPGAVICGRCKIKNNVMIGAGSTVIDKVSITDNVIVGAGSTVINNIGEAGTYVGTPAKKIGE